MNHPKFIVPIQVEEPIRILRVNNTGAIQLFICAIYNQTLCTNIFSIHVITRQGFSYHSEVGARGLLNLGEKKHLDLQIGKTRTGQPF